MKLSRRQVLKHLALGMGLALAPSLALATESALDLALKGQELLANGQFAEAVQILDRAAALEPENDYVLGLLGQALWKSGDTARARQSFQKAVSLNPSDTYSRLMLEHLRQKPGAEPVQGNDSLSELERLARSERNRISASGASQEMEKYQIRRVVLDPGHGGFDPGAVGPGGLKEKDLALDIGRRAALALEREAPHVKVFLTRSDDYFLPLGNRTAMANRHRADLFVSLHVNAFTKASANGLETYFCSEKASTREAERVASLENAVLRFDAREHSEAKWVDIEDILFRFERKRHWQAGGKAAQVVQDRLAGKLPLRDRGVHSANFHVLRTARMPSMLLETGFISNPTEEALLAREDQRQLIAEGLAHTVSALAREGV